MFFVEGTRVILTSGLSNKNASSLQHSSMAQSSKIYQARVTQPILVKRISIHCWFLCFMFFFYNKENIEYRRPCPLICHECVRTALCNIIKDMRKLLNSDTTSACSQFPTNKQNNVIICIISDGDVENLFDGWNESHPFLL